MESRTLQEGLVERLYWLIRLRWIAVGGVFATVLFSNKILEFSLPIFPLYTLAGILAVCNLIFFILLKKFKGKETTPVVNRIANAQISADLLILSFLIHFSGGIDNPFIFYFIFHMIIASILLDRLASFLQATLAVCLFCIIVMLEYLGIISHYCLEGLIIYDQYDNIAYIYSVFFVFITTIYIAVYLTSSISSRLREREKTLMQTNELLKEKDRIKSEYVLSVSHDIKEHLAAIQICLEPVAAGITGKLNLKQSNLFKRAVQRTSKLILFVKTLLEITRLRLNKKLTMDYLSIQDTVEEAISFISSKAKSKSISVHCIIESRIHRIRGAKEYIFETITNLLVNAVKYTPRNGRIDITVRDKGNAVLLEIADNGIGIPHAELPRIFEEFYRASNVKEAKEDGTGLGLSIAKQIVELHNGTIWAESQEGKGSTFFIMLPK